MDTAALAALVLPDDMAAPGRASGVAATYDTAAPAGGHRSRPTVPARAGTGPELRWSNSLKGGRACEQLCRDAMIGGRGCIMAMAVATPRIASVVGKAGATVAPSGLRANLYGPDAQRRAVAKLLRESQAMNYTDMIRCGYGVRRAASR
jgi:hypothetical protein